MSTAFSRPSVSYAMSFGGAPEVVTEVIGQAGTNTSAAQLRAPRGAGNTGTEREMLIGPSPRVRVGQASGTQNQLNLVATTESDPQTDAAPWVAREEKLQEWEGRVTTIFSDHFVAKLIDLTAAEDHEKEQGEFPMDEVSDADRKLLRENAVFRWIIGYRYIGATKERFARIVFRRLPAWSAMELRTASQAARKLAQELVWD
jgi:hypothetical protein